MSEEEQQQCAGCGKQFSDEEKYEKHIGKTEDEEETIVLCPAVSLRKIVSRLDRMTDSDGRLIVKGDIHTFD